MRRCRSSADTEARLERYRNERERLGAVNLRAEAEATELAERRDALTGERDDLIAAIHRLRQGISSLNREGRERLMAAFDTVNEHFKRLFHSLFGGGTAELQLTESDDPLEAGLEIVARPPGKKPQIMTLLSGGEQALTAMSLIFAVFLTNPAPICVLDEVDAPLDDANVERFCNLLEEMARLDRHALHHHHPQPDHHGAHEPAVRRHHGRARRLAARLRRPGDGGKLPRGELGTGRGASRKRGPSHRHDDALATGRAVAVCALSPCEQGDGGLRPLPLRERASRLESESELGAKGEGSWRDVDPRSLRESHPQRWRAGITKKLSPLVVPHEIMLAILAR